MFMSVLQGVPLPRANAQPPSTPGLPEVRIGFPKALFKDVHPGLIEAAAKPFQDMIQKTAGMSGSLEIAPDYKDLAQKLSNNKLDIALFHGFEYAWVKHDPNLIPIVITVPNCGKVQACLVVNTTSTAKSVSDLKGACVAIPRGSKAHCEMFFERIREEIPAKERAECCCPAKLGRLTPEEALDAVVNNDCEAALVDVSALIAYRNGRPGVSSWLKVLRESEPLPSAVVVYRNGSLTPEQVKNVRDGLVNCVKTPMGKTFVLFWNLKGFEDVTDSYKTLLEKCRVSYPPPAAPK
jgi:ABC-type phosphate/phosphonate transport system substrate-binding protein